MLTSRSGVETRACDAQRSRTASDVACSHRAFENSGARSNATRSESVGKSGAGRRRDDVIIFHAASGCWMTGQKTQQCKSAEYGMELPTTCTGCFLTKVDGSEGALPIVDSWRKPLINPVSPVVQSLPEQTWQDWASFRHVIRRRCPFRFSRPVPATCKGALKGL